MTVNPLLLHSFKLVLLSCWAEFGDHRMSIVHLSPSPTKQKPRSPQQPENSLSPASRLPSCLSCSGGFRMSPREESVQRFVCSVGPFFFQLYCKRTVLGRYKNEKSSSSCFTKLSHQANIVLLFPGASSGPPSTPTNTRGFTSPDLVSIAD